MRRHRHRDRQQRTVTSSASLPRPFCTAHLIHVRNAGAAQEAASKQIRRMHVSQGVWEGKRCKMPCRVLCWMSCGSLLPACAASARSQDSPAMPERHRRASKAVRAMAASKHS